MTNVTKDDVQYFAKFAWMDMSDEQAELFAEKLSELITFTSHIQEVETDQVEPMTHPLQLFNVMREDVPHDVLDREEMLQSVKEHEDGMIKVPSIL